MLFSQLRLLLLHLVIVGAERSFTIANDRFLLDGQATRLLASEMHYFRIPPAYWMDRLKRVQSMGLNAVQVYVPWNWHEMEEGVYDFHHGHKDLPRFLRMAQELGLMVLLRLGPYMCGEWDFGGLPWWLLYEKKEGAPLMKLRTFDPKFIHHVDRYWGHLLPIVRPFLYENGGPVIMCQVENEYGFYGDVENNEKDRAYLQHLIDLCRKYLGPNVILYTTDGYPEEWMRRGSLEGEAVLTLGDFGPGRDLEEARALQNSMNPPGKSPFMCTEYYTGWLTHWGEAMANTSTTSLVSTLNDLLAMGGSVSLYMGHGGTNFGFWNGANDNIDGVPFTSHQTSYDYDAPVAEGGEHGYGPQGGDKFTAITDTITKYVGDSGPPEPPLLPRGSIGTIALPYSIGLFEMLDVSTWGSPIRTHRPRHMEQYNQSMGFILYRTVLGPEHSQGNLSLEGVRDRAQVWVNSVAVGTSYRGGGPLSLSLPDINGPAAQLDILVENMGRINFGWNLYDPKGLYGKEVLVSGVPLGGDWTVFRLPFNRDQVDAITARMVATKGNKDLHQREQQPRLFYGSFRLDKPVDLYLDMRPWNKGVVWLNGVNLGRYWMMGPQRHLFVPSTYLLGDGENHLLVLELHDPPKTEVGIDTVDGPIFTKSSRR